MSAAPLCDYEIVALDITQFYALMKEDNQVKEQVCRISPTKAPYATRKIFETKEISPLFPLNYVDKANEALKDNTHMDMFAWKDAFFSGRSVVRQITLMGVNARVVLSKARNGTEYVIIKGFAGLREKLKGTRYLRSNPVFKEAEFVFSHGEMLREGLKASKVGVLVLVAWEVVHELCQDRFSWVHLGTNQVCDILQAIVGLAAGVLVGAVILLLFPGAVVVAAIGVAFVSGGAGWLMSRADFNSHHTDHLTEMMKKIKNSDHPLTTFKEYAASIGKECIELLSGDYIYFKH